MDSLKRENGHVTEVVTNGGRMITLEKLSPMEEKWSCYRSGQFRAGRMVHVMVVVSLMEGEWSCYRGGLFNGGE